MTRGHFYRFALQFARLLTAPPGFDELMVANDFGETAIDGIGCLKEFARGGVCKLDDALCICDEHAIGHLFKDGGKAGAFSIEGCMLRVEGGCQRCNGAG